MRYSVYNRSKDQTLVFVSGYMFGSWVYRDVDKYFDDYNLILIDQIGFCSSSSSNIVQNFSKESDQLYTVLEKYNFHNVAMLGHSMGGFFVQRFNQCYPDRVDNIILIATCNPKDFLDSPRMSSIDMLEELFELSDKNFIGLTVNALFSEVFLENKSNYSEISKSIKSDQPQIGICRSQLIATSLEIEESVDDYKCNGSNILIIIPKHDRVIPKEVSFKLAEKYPRAEISLVPGEHMYFYEDPNFFRKQVLSWIDREVV